MAIQTRRPAGRRAATVIDSTFTVLKKIGASVDYNGHPTIADGTLQVDVTGFDGRLATAAGVTGNQLAGPHGYPSSTNQWPTTFAASAVGWAPGAGYSFSWFNAKIGSYTGWAAAADSGSWDSHLTNYVNSVPDGHTHILLVHHEPENDLNGGPSVDGGAWENQYGPDWSRMEGRFANLVASINKPNVYFAVCLMTFTFPNNGTPGSLGGNQRNPRKYNAWQYMTPAAKARTIFAPDGYTDVLTTGGSFDTMASEFDKAFDYVAADGWGVQWVGVTEHTLNNDINASDAITSGIWKNDVRPYLRSLPNLSYYLLFNHSTGLASGVNGWVDGTLELQEFAALAREFNLGAGGGTGGTSIAFRAAATGTTANSSTPTVTIPSSAQIGDYCFVQFSCSTTPTVTDMAGWTVHASQDVGSLRTRVYGKKLASGEPGSAVGPTISAISRWCMEAVAYSGVHATTPMDATPVVSTDTATATTHTCPAITTVTAAATVVQVALNRGTTTLNTAVWSAPSGYVPRSSVYPTAAPGTSGAFADLANAAVGTYGPSTWTSDAALGAFCGVTLALRPA